MRAAGGGTAGTSVTGAERRAADERPSSLAAAAELDERLPDETEKHTLSVFVADEPGMINRVAGVFARRGFNIESLAVGLTFDRAIMTMVVAANPSKIKGLVKQLYKLVNVRKVEDLTYQPRVERELCLTKVRVTDATRTHMLELANIFRMRVIDVGENSFTFETTGDPGKIEAGLRSFERFGILEVARTGKVALRREDSAGMGVHDPETGAAACPSATDVALMAGGAATEVDGSAAGTNPVGLGLEAAGSALASTSAYEVAGHHLNALLDPLADGGAEDGAAGEQYDGVMGNGLFHRSRYIMRTISIIVDDEPGVLNRVTACFARRGYSIQSLAVGPAELPSISRMTIVLPADEDSLPKLVKQIYKLVGVQSVVDLTDEPYAERELMLIKVRAAANTRSEIIDLAKIFRARITDVSACTVTMELTGDLEKMIAFQELMEGFGIVEVARTGRVCLLRESGVDTRFLDRRVAKQAKL